MRHRKAGRQLNRNSSHRKAMFKNMAASLFEHELIKTTLPKAKELRRVAEPLITMASRGASSLRKAGRRPGFSLSGATRFCDPAQRPVFGAGFAIRRL